MHALQKGDYVFFDHTRNGRRYYGQITTIGRKNIKLIVVEGGRSVTWTVNADMVVRGRKPSETKQPARPAPTPSTPSPLPSPSPSQKDNKTRIPKKKRTKKKMKESLKKQERARKRRRLLMDETTDEDDSSDDTKPLVKPPVAAQEGGGDETEEYDSDEE